jgi:hypothetical protein
VESHERTIIYQNNIERLAVHDLLAITGDNCANHLFQGAGDECPRFSVHQFTCRRNDAVLRALQWVFGKGCTGDVSNRPNTDGGLQFIDRDHLTGTANSSSKLSALLAIWFFEHDWHSDFSAMSSLASIL